MKELYRINNKSISEHRLDDGEIVNSFSELIHKIGAIQNIVPEYMIYFRGQSIDYSLKEGTNLLPSIYRKNTNGELHSYELKERIEKLIDTEEKVMKYFYKKKIGLNDFNLFTKLNRNKELKWALIQHYEIAKTPLIDLTYSIDVAATFALLGNKNDYGYIYLIALPYPKNSIDINVDEKLINIRLNCFCPPEARRPHYQDGILVGTYPFDYDNTERKKEYDIASRLIKKFRIKNSKEFWDKDFKAIPESIIYPGVYDNPFEKYLVELKLDINSNNAKQPFIQKISSVNLNNQNKDKSIKKLGSYSGLICTEFNKFTDLDHLAKETGCKNPYPFTYEGVDGEISIDNGATWRKITLPNNLIIGTADVLEFENQGFGVGVINFIDWFNSIMEFQKFKVKYYSNKNLGYVLECPEKIHFWFNFIEKYGCDEIEDFKYRISNTGDCWDNWDIVSSISCEMSDI